MSRARRLGFWRGVLLFSAGVGCWMFWAPYPPAVLYRAIPASATFVSAHAQLAERWQSLAGNPAAVSVGRAMGYEPGDLEALRRDPDVQALLDQLAPKETVLAYLPSAGLGAEPAWVFSSWLGGRAQRLRWLLHFSSPSELEKLGRVRGHAVWRILDSGLPPPYTLHAVLVEGAVIGCISRDAGALSTVLDAYDGLAPALYHRRAALGLPLEVAAEAVADRGWLRISGAGSAGRVVFDLEEAGPDRLSGRLRWCGVPGLPAPGTARFTEFPSAIWGDAPCAAAAVDVGVFEALLMPFFSPSWEQVVQLLRDRVGGGPAALGFFTGAYSGRLFGMKIPGAVLAWKVPPDLTARAVLNDLLDTLNTQHQWGLIDVPWSEESPDLRVIEATTDVPYARFSREERLAVVQAGSWSPGGLRMRLAPRPWCGPT